MVLILLLSLGCKSQTPTTAESDAAANPEAKISEASNVPPPETITVTLRTWPRIVNSQGSLEADQITTVASEVAGPVLKLLVDIGDAVEVGQPIAEINSREYDLLLQQATARFHQAKAAVGLTAEQDVDQLKPESAPPSREAKAVWDESIQQVKRLQELSRQNAVSATDLEAGEAAQRVAEARYASALNLVREKMAAIALQAAELAITQKQLDDTQIVAPISGRIQSRNISVGNYVSPGDSLFTIAIVKRLRYRSSVPERYAQQIALGQTVNVRTDASSKIYPTKIENIAPMLDRRNRSLAFEAFVNNQDESIRPGLFAQSDIIIDETSQSIIVPNTALTRFAGSDKLWKMSDGKPQEVIVKVARRNENETEIVKGLEVGELVLIKPVTKK